MMIAALVGNAQPALAADDDNQSNDPRMDFKPAIAQFEAAIKEEVAAGRVTGVSYALVYDQKLVYVSGLGLADKKTNRAADADTIYRVGSISKLFTAVAAMQLVEAGKLDIDKPITDYDPAFAIVDPFDDAAPVNARQLMSHRSGIIRESPVGSYFDPTQPGIEATVRSIAPTVRVYRPGQRTKYSNVGPTIVGLVIEKITGKSFPDYQRDSVLGPLGMTSSAWLMNDALRPRLSKAYLPVADAEGNFTEITAPEFELGTIPAGNLYSTAGDLAKFAMCLLAGGRIEAGPQSPVRDVAPPQLLRDDTLAEMLTPQLTDDRNNFGLGFFIGQYGQHRAAWHSGAVYGFSSSFTIIPKHKIAVIVLNNDDISGGPLRKISHAGLSGMLGVVTGEKRPARPKPADLSPDELGKFAGVYESESFWATIEVKGGVLAANISNQRITLTPIGGDRFDAFGRVAWDVTFAFERDLSGGVNGFTGMGQKFRRLSPDEANRPMPKAFQPLLGSYGHDFIPLIIVYKHGRLYATTENMYDYRLTPLNVDTFKLCPGMYTDEEMVFHRNKRGRAQRINFCNVVMERRPR